MCGFPVGWIPERTRAFMRSEEANLILNEVTAEKWVYGGDSLSRLEGQVVLTPYLMPGETARVDAVAVKGV